VTIIHRWYRRQCACESFDRKQQRPGSRPGGWRKVSSDSRPLRHLHPCSLNRSNEGILASIIPLLGVFTLPSSVSSISYNRVSFVYWRNSHTTGITLQPRNLVSTAVALLMLVARFWVGQAPSVSHSPRIAVTSRLPSELTQTPWYTLPVPKTTGITSIESLETPLGPGTQWHPIVI